MSSSVRSGGSLASVLAFVEGLAQDADVRVCIDIQAAVSQRAGVGRYTRRLVEHLGPVAEEAWPGLDLNLFCFDFKRQADLPDICGARNRTVRWIPGRVVQQAWKRVGFPPFNWFAGGAEVTHFPNFIRPPLSRGRSVVTVHDLTLLRAPETMEPKNLAYQTAHLAKTLQRADRIITDCQFVADELVADCGVDRSRVMPIHLGLDAAFVAPPADVISAFKQRHAIDRPYLLHVGTVEPRKNHAFLFEAFAALKDRGLFDGELLLVGGRGWKSEETFAAVARHPDIRHLGFVPDAELPALYAGAEVFVFPSLYEGFGFPPLEAMQCGTPVVASTRGSLREVLGEGAELVEDFSVDAWVESIRRARNRDGGVGRRWATRYQWADTARATLEVYRSLA